MEQQIREQDGVTIVSVEGPLDVARSLELREILGERISVAGARVVLDLAAVPLLDSSGIGVLVTAHRRAEQAGATFAIATPAAPVTKVLEMTRADRLLRIFPSLDAALLELSA